MVTVEQISGEVCSTNVPRLALESGAFSFGGKIRHPQSLPGDLNVLSCNIAPLSCGDYTHSRENLDLSSLP